jgi:hypothetical protein
MERKLQVANSADASGPRVWGVGIGTFIIIVSVIVSVLICVVGAGTAYRKCVCDESVCVVESDVTCFFFPL